MIKHLGQRPGFLGWLRLNNKDCAFVFQGATGPVMITWAPKGTSDYVDFSGPVSIVNPLSGLAYQDSSCTLTEAPIMIDNPPSALVEQAQANRTRPFLWDNDYSKARSVSVTFGDTNIEKGLHTQSAESIASDVVTYGGSSRSGSVPGGTVFMVDPSFLTYNRTPIQISIVVRRNAANDNAGFKLVYESTNGYKDCGWYTVPDNKDWHTVSWTITDPEFVSMWGYNFALNSDGNQYNNYCIQSVTVTKLAP
jgi:hypothetical protein